MTEHATLAAALAAFQAELPTIKKTKTAKVKTKDGGQFSYGYAGLAEVSATVMPLLGKHGLSFTAKPTVVDGKFVLAYRLLHASGDADEGVYPLSSGSAQEQGSAITYARRYALCSVTGVAAEEDDDGAAAKAGWDQDREQDQLLNADGFSDEIRLAKTGDDLTTVSKNIRRSVAKGDITKAQYDRLVQEGSARRAELDQAARDAAGRAEADQLEMMGADA